MTSVGYSIEYYDARNNKYKGLKQLQKITSALEEWGKIEISFIETNLEIHVAYSCRTERDIPIFKITQLKEFP